MSLISHRECHLVGVKNEDLNKIVEEIKAFVADANVSRLYKVAVLKEQVACCGYIPIGVTIEVEGPKDQIIKDLHEKIYGKIKEICGREKIEHHECSAVETLQNIEGVTFIQG